jgi:CHAT domain-containing protein
VLIITTPVRCGAAFATSWSWFEEGAMNSEYPVRKTFRLLLACLVVLTTGVRLSFAQQAHDPQQLQKAGIVKIDHWLDYARRTGDAKSKNSELTAAQSELKDSYDLFLQRQDFAGASWSAIKMGDIQRLLNRWARSVPLYKTAVDLARRANRTDYQTRGLARLVISELKIGAIKAAEEHSREAVRLGPKCGNKNFYFEALDVASGVEAKLGNRAAASDYLDRALAMSGQIDDKRLLYQGYADRGDTYYEVATKCDYQTNADVCSQSLELARADYQKAVFITQDLGYDFLSQLFRAQLKSVDDQKALLRMRTVDLSAKHANMFNPKTPHDVLVTEHFAAGAMDPQNLAMIESAVKNLKDWWASLQKQGLPVEDLNSSDLNLQGQLAEMKGNNQDALGKYQRAIHLVEKDRRKLRDEQARGALMEDKINYYYRPAQLLLEQKRYPEAFELFERSRSRAMADMLSTRPLSLRTMQERTLFTQLETLKVKIAAQQEKLFNLTGSHDRNQHTTEIVQLEKQITDLQQQYDQLETRIEKETPRLKMLVTLQPETLKNVQNSAAAGAYDILYYVVLDTAVILWHINGSGVQVKNVFLPRSQLMKKVGALHESLIAPRDDAAAAFDNETSRQLYLYLIQPVVSFITSRHLIIIAHQELTSIPFQALQDPAIEKYLGEDYEISYAPSATILARLDKKRNLGPGSLLAVADPEIHDATEEVEAIGRLYPGRSKIVARNAAHKADIRAWVADYSVVHLSVHGKFTASDPLLSYLEFQETESSDGRLTAAEMFGLPLKEHSLVVLSACETGRVETTQSGEALGMVRSLLYAGAGNLVLSSWEVNAASTKLWMENFYREGQTKSPAEAARLALLAVKSRPKYSHPFYWAPFVMTGK